MTFISRRDFLKSAGIVGAAAPPPHGAGAESPPGGGRARGQPHERPPFRAWGPRELRRLGFDRLSRRPHYGQRGRSAAPREKRSEGEPQVGLRLRVVHEGRSKMTTRLKDTDVVIIGLGAAGGVAALPLAQAGLDVIGLEAGPWVTKRDFAPDELRNNYPGRPPAGPKAKQEIPTSRATPSSPAVAPPHA